MGWNMVEQIGLSVGMVQQIGLSAGMVDLEISRGSLHLSPKVEIIFLTIINSVNGYFDRFSNK